MAHTPNMKAKIDFSKVKGIKDLKIILESFQIGYDGPVPENMLHFLVPISEEKTVINFAKVKTVSDIKLILESLQMEFDAAKVPENMKHMTVTYDANVPIKNA